MDRRVPQILGGELVDKQTSGRRDLADMIVNPENPLTARVFVNWVWTHHFGQGSYPYSGRSWFAGRASIPSGITR